MLTVVEVRRDWLQNVLGDSVPSCLIYTVSTDDQTFVGEPSISKKQAPYSSFAASSIARTQFSVKEALAQALVHL